MAKTPTSVPAGKPAKFVRGTWPPQPQPLYEQTAKALDVKPQDASTRDYGKTPLGGNTGLSGQS